MCCTQQLSLKYARAMSLGLLIISITKEKGNSYTSSEVFNSSCYKSVIHTRKKKGGGGGGGGGQEEAKLFNKLHYWCMHS